MNTLGDNIERAYDELVYDEWERHRNCINELTHVYFEEMNEIIGNTNLHSMTQEERKQFREEMKELEEEYKHNFEQAEIEHRQRLKKLQC